MEGQLKSAYLYPPLTTEYRQSDTFRVRRAGRRARYDFSTGKERTTPTPQAADGKAAGKDTHTGTMILASAMRHSVGRPATGMEGGIGLWSGSPAAD